MPSDTTSRPDLMWMVAFHSALRRDLAHLARTASRDRSDDPARRTAVLTGWELFKTQLHIHHTGEDTDLWPRMRAHLSGRPDDLALLQAMEDEQAASTRWWTASTARSPTQTTDMSGWRTRLMP